MDFDIEKMCRVCLKTDVESILLFEHQKNVGGVSIADMISDLTIYNIRRHDDFPHLICYECIERVENAYSFKTDFETAQRKLITYLDSINKYQLTPDANAKPTADKSTQTIDSTLYPCEKCDLKFIKYERLREHRASAHKGSANLCRICHKTFNRLAGLKSHIMAAHPEIGYHNSSNQCYVCNKMFTRRDHVTRHIRNVHKIQTSGVGIGRKISNDGVFSGDMFNPIFEAEEGESNEDVGGMFGYNAEPKPYIECLVCYQHFSSKNRLTRHMQIVHQLDASQILKQEQTNDVSNFKSEMEMLVEPDAYTTGFTIEDGEMSNEYDNEDEDHDGDEDEEEDEEDEDGDNHHDDAEEDSEEDMAMNSTEFVSANCFVKCEEQIHEVETPKFEVANTLRAIKQEKTEIKITNVEQIRSTSTFDCFHKIDDGQFACNLCEKTFKSPYHVKRHFLSHTQEKAFACTVCDMRFSRNDHLKNHMTKHNPIKPYPCDSCNASYGRSDHLKRHKIIHHSADSTYSPSKAEVCVHCNKSYSSKAYLQKHMLKHTEKCWKCKLCPVQFESSEELKEHAKTHNKDRPFLCSECGLCFPRKNYLIIHMRRHNGERPYKCQYCDKGFPRSTDLKAHEKCHTGEKTHFCNVCGKGFPRPYKLSVHMRIHTGEKPYSCMYCPKAFAQCNDLKAHIRRHTGERFRCELCGVGFIQKYNLTQHKADVHGIFSESRLGRVSKVATVESTTMAFPDEPNNDTDDKVQLGLTTNLVFRGVALH